MAPQSVPFSLLLTILQGYYWLEDGVRNYVQAQGHPSFTRSEGLVMAHVILGNQRPADMAQGLGISRQAVHTTIRQMEDKGIVEMREDPENRRLRLVQLTSTGQQMRNDGMEAMEMILSELGQRIGKRKVTQLTDILAADWGPTMTFEAPASDKD